ncbi:GatB/YqeY domain-containing protein [Devosia sp.]|uniref:GatB/YqeY domain-containing protein n=1 Tax=Devosia sp. TaxID=1871048 RepID=UPI003BA9E565
MRETISEGYKTALKAGDKRRTATLRSINAAIKDKDIEARGLGKDPLGDGDLIVLLQKMIKQREESLGIYEKAGRDDLAVVEREEIAILTEFVPAGMSEAEIEAAIAAAIAKTGAAGAKDMGKVIASLKADFPGRIDFGKASAKVKAALG